jgi:hypothetical protein
MAAPRDGQTRLADRAKIATWYLEGKTQVFMASELGRNRETIAEDLAAIREMWLESTIHDFNERMSIELAKIENIEQIAWQKFWESCERQEKVTVETGAGRMGPINSTKTESVDKPVGDPRWLQQVSWCIDRRCKIFGFDAPDKHVTVSLEMVKLYAQVDLDRV